MGELHLGDLDREAESSDSACRRENTELIKLGKPLEIAYRQCLSKMVDFEYKFAKQTGGRGKFAVIAVKYAAP